MKNTFSDENFKKSNHAPRRAHDLISGEKPNSWLFDENVKKFQWLTPHAADPYSFLVVVCRSCMSIAGTVFCSTVCKTIVIPSDQEEMQEKGKKARHQLSKVVKT